MKPSKFKIGIFDSGLGGLTVLRELLINLPQEQYVYLGDMARTPYGSKGSETVIRYSKECANFLLQQKIDLLVVACNTSSSVALEELRSIIPCPLIGTIDPAVRIAFNQAKVKKVGIIGTEATIASGVYEEKIKKINPQIDVYSVSCPLFVPLVEQGMLEGEIVDKIIEHHLAELKTKEIDTLILACTHYPLLINAINKFFGPQVKTIECSKAISEEVKNKLDLRSSSPSKATSVDFYVTDAVSRFDKLARLFLQQPEHSILKGALKVDL